MSRTEEPAKASTCARDRRALQQLVLNVHVKHSDLTLPNKSNILFGRKESILFKDTHNIILFRYNAVLSFVVVNLTNFIYYLETNIANGITMSYI